MNKTKVYESKEDCKKNHINELGVLFRYKSTMTCVECARINNEAFRAKHRGDSPVMRKQQRDRTMTRPVVYRRALEEALQWHQDELRIIAKSGKENKWYELQHQEQINLINTALDFARKDNE